MLVGAGDNLFRFDLAAYLDDFDQGEGSLVLVSRETDRAKLSRSGVAEIDASRRLVRLWEKPSDPPSEYCCPPLYLLDSAAISQIGACRRAHPEADAPGNLIAWVAERELVRVYEMRGKRLDVGNAESYASAEA